MTVAVQRTPAATPVAGASHSVATTSVPVNPSPKQEKVLGYTIDILNVKGQSSGQTYKTLCVGTMIVGTGNLTQDQANGLLKQGKGAMLVLQDKKLHTVIVSPGVYKDLITANVLKDNGVDKVARISTGELGKTKGTFSDEYVKVLSYTEEQYKQMVVRFSK